MNNLLSATLAQKKVDEIKKYSKSDPERASVTEYNLMSYFIESISTNQYMKWDIIKIANIISECKSINFERY